MNSVYETEIDNDVILSNLTRILNQTYSLLPKYEEGQEWKKPLETLMLELLGLWGLFPDKEDLLSLVCKMEGLWLKAETEGDIEFMLYRRNIFELCSLIAKIKDSIKEV